MEFGRGVEIAGIAIDSAGVVVIALGAAWALAVAAPGEICRLINVLYDHSQQKTL